MLGKRFTAVAIAVCTAVSVGLVSGSPASAAPELTRIVLVQAAPVIAHEEGQDPTSARGDVTFFEASLSRAGKPFGSLSGTIETHDLVLEGASREVRLRTLVFDLPRGQLVAQGVSSYATGPDFVPLDVNAPVVIAITGGTGAYLGATGEVRTTRRADGTYRQVISLLRN